MLIRLSASLKFHKVLNLLRKYRTVVSIEALGVVDEVLNEARPATNLGFLYYCKQRIALLVLEDGFTALVHHILS